MFGGTLPQDRDRTGRHEHKGRVVVALHEEGLALAQVYSREIATASCRRRTAPDGST